MDKENRRTGGCVRLANEQTGENMTGKQADRHTEGQTDRQTGRQSHIQIDSQTFPKLKL